MPHSRNGRTRDHADRFLRAARLALVLGVVWAAGTTWAQSQPAAAPSGPATAATAVVAQAPEPAGGSAARFNVQRGLLILVLAGVLAGIGLARRGHALPLRDIPALTVFDEAVSRATEMGRPSLFSVGGACDIRKIQLFGSMPLLREVAKLSGRLGNRLIIPVCYPETLPVHTNTMRDGYLDAGALDAYRPGDVRFFPGGQFFFAMATMGWMLEERPATCFYFGWWEADALMVAETGQTIGALQIAGTDQLYQIPFFIAACDYVIIGEEFWAASAKISRDAQLLGSLGAQDLFKLATIGLIVLGVGLCFVPALATVLQVWRKLFS